MRSAPCGIFNDCPPISAAERAKVAAAIAGADSFTEYTWSKDGQPPIISWDSAFDRLIEKRTALLSDLTKRGYCPYPWAILAALPARRRLSDFFYWNQGSLPSCSMHAASHAAQGAVLTDMFLGAPLVYDALNPIYPFYRARGGNFYGGLSIYETAEYVNRTGYNAVSEVGADNTHAPRDADRHLDESARRQAAIVYLEDDWTDRIFRAAAAGFHVVFGSYTIYTSSRIDANGVKTGHKTTRGGHAQSFGSWRRIAGEEYVFITNSHGEIYSRTSEGDPPNGCWLTRGQVEEVADSFDVFGPPFIVLPENPDQTEPSLITDFNPVFPKGFRKEA